jgi:hypothetical protein
VSADLVAEGTYEVTLVPAAAELRGPGGSCRLRPGMAAQADVSVRQTRVLPWLLGTWRITG